MEKESKEKKVEVTKEEKVKKKSTEVKEKKTKKKETVKKVTETKKATKKVTDADTPKKIEKEKVEVNKDKESLKKSFEITVPSSEIEKSINEIAEKYSSDIKLSGFRKGKVPAELLKSRYKGALNEEALNKIVEEYVFKKIEEDKIKIVSQPQIDKIDHKEGEDLTAAVTVEVYPEFELPELENIEVEIPVKDLEIKAYNEKEQIDLVLNSRRRLVNIRDREIKDEDVVSFNFQTKILRTKKMTPRKEESFEMLKDKESVIKEIYKELIGKKIGEKLTFERTYPKSYSKKKWAGEKVEHIVDITKVQGHFTPKLDSDLLKELGFKDESSFKKKLKEDYETYSKNQLDEIKNNKKIEKLIEMIQFPIPVSLVDQEKKRIQNDPQRAYLMSDEALLQKKAEESVKFSLIHFEIQKKYKIEANSEDLENEFKKMSEQFKMPVKDIRKYYSGAEQKETLKDRIKGDKVIELLKEKIKIKEIK